MKTILSGIQSSGKLHLGNYFGALRQHIQMQEKGDAFYFIANYHSMTSINDGEEIYENTMDIALDYLALGLDPEKCTFFAQSDVQQVTELAWLLDTCSTVCKMEKAVAYKDKVARWATPTIGLFIYSVLQARHILFYNSAVVPVAQHEKQNTESCRDLAGR